MKRIITVIMSLIVMVISIVGAVPMKVFAASTNEIVIGRLYEFEKKSHYEVSTTTSSGNTNTNMGTLSIYGNMNSISDVNGFKAYEVNDGNVSIKYSLGDVYANASDANWYLISDKSKKVDSITLNEDILKGAVVVQTSMDGRKWITDKALTNIAGDSAYNGLVCVSNNIQQVNGCYYRIIIAYELERKTGKNLIGVATHEQKKYAEVYEFYLVNSSENGGSGISPTATPRKELGDVVNTGKDNGFSGSNPLTAKDPHYGWTIGTFFVNGYTRETTQGNSVSPIFLKNVGDRVTLWFYLKQDITSLDGESNLQISEDINGYDQFFQTDKTNMKHGTLIIRYTDHEGVKHDPVIYTDYLAANTRTGANTKVELFEEGDYEVALDYEIVDTTRIDSYTNYKIQFAFSIRNGNCMVYPFDVVSGMELSDGAITSNGFRLDMAKSRYLTIDVQKAVLIENADGSISKDVRFNRPAKDGDSYTDEGIYTFSVKNVYTGEETTKVIYVGENHVLKALSTYELTIDELNVLISEGSIVEADGTIKSPVVEEITTTESSSAAVRDDVGIDKEISESKEQNVADVDVAVEENKSEKGKGTNTIVIVVVGIMCLGGIAGSVIVGLKKRKDSEVDTVNSDPEEGESEK